ncbi:MAG: hypothetical protein V4601_04625 [Pseudomonadota bacterium]
MKIQIAAITLTALALGACMGPHGNPNGSPYADQPGGTIAVKPETIGTETYDPGKPAAPFQGLPVAPYNTTPATPAPR